MAFRNMEELSQAIAQSGQSWSDADRSLAQKDIDYGNSIFTLKNDWLDATKRGDTSAAKDIHDRTEDFRKQYGGYAGGADGSGFIKDSTYFRYDDPYKSTLDGLADQLVNYQKYKNPYQDRLDAAADRLESYGPFVNPYQQQIDDAADRLGSYDPYQNPYQTQTDEVLDKYLGRGPFQYELDSDPLWQNYQKTYLREGQRAREDTLGNYAAATGGQASTAAVNAASQAQDYYSAQMTDKIPELYQFAYDQWLNEGNQYANQLNTLRGLNSDALNAWSANLGLLGTQLGSWRSLGSDKLAEWDANRGLLNDQLNAWRDRGNDALTEWNANLGLLNNQISSVQGISDNQYDRAYQANRDSLSDTRYDDETAYTRDQYANETQYNRAQEQKKQALSQALEWMQMGLRPSDEVLSAAGLSGQEVSDYIRAVQAQAAAKGGSGGGSGGRSGSSGGGAGSASGPDYSGLFEAAYRSGHPESYIAENYKKFGFSKSTGLVKDYNSTHDEDFDAIVKETRDMIDKSEYSQKATLAHLRAKGYDEKTIEYLMDVVI